jgi:type I restriction enzyme R subunit
MSDGQFNMVLQQKSKSVAGRDDQASRNSYQSEDQLEKHLIEILCSQGYEYLTEVKSEEAMQANLRLQMEKLNRAKLMERPDGQGKGKFSDQEWQRFFDTIIANKSEGLLEKTRKLRQAHSFALDCGGGANPAGTSIPTCISKADAAGSSIPTVGVERNFRLLSQDPSENNFQVINQIERNSGGHKNRYDVTILVNGLPLVHIELKRRGVALQEAFHQVNRYRRESFWSESGLFNYVQIFIISNGTLTKYYSNTVRELSRMGQQGHLVTQNKTFAYEFASPWTDKKNNPIYDLCDFSRDFLEYRRLTVMLTRYCVLGTDDAMRILRPYQAHAVEAIERRVDISAARPGTPEAGGYIWHTTGSGKTLTSFVAATLLTEREDIDKVLFIVDRKDLDYQTMIEFNRFSKGSVDGTNNTKQLTGQLESSDQKIIVTTIQKLDRYIRQHRSSPFKQKRVVLIFDECHRSQFGIFHRNITGFFSRYHLFGFSGTPIFKLLTRCYRQKAGTEPVRYHRSHLRRPSLPLYDYQRYPRQECPTFQSGFYPYYAEQR